MKEWKSKVKCDVQAGDSIVVVWPYEGVVDDHGVWMGSKLRCHGLRLRGRLSF